MRLSSPLARPILVLACLASSLIPLAAAIPELWYLPPDLNDGSFHLGVLRQTIAALASEGSSLDFWVPTWLGGFPLFHYYQFGPYLLLAWIDSLLPWAVDVRLLYRLANLTVLASFPLTNFVALRWLRMPREVAVAGALLAFAISGGARYGIELESFTWYGWGLFTQAVALPLLPLALAGGWRALQGTSRTLSAAALLAVVSLAHILYGYIAVLSLTLVVLTCPSWPALRRCSLRAALVLTQFLLLIGFFLVPLLEGRAYHALSLYDAAEKFDSFGASTILVWLVSGDFLDHGRLPVLTFFCAAGLYLSLRDWLLRGDRVRGWIAFAFVAWLSLYFGRPTWGAWIDWLPASRGLHLERLSSAVQFFALWLAAIAVGDLLRWCRTAQVPAWQRAGVALGLVGALASVAAERGRYLARNSAAISETVRKYATDEPAFAPVLDYLRAHPGRVFAGRRGNWGQHYTVAGVPVYHLLSAAAIEQVANAPFSWALTTDFQVQLDTLDERLIQLYDIAFFLAPSSIAPPIGAQLILESGPHRLYRLQNSGRFAIVRVPIAISGAFETTWSMTQSWDKGLWSQRANHARLLWRAEEIGNTPVLRMLDAFHFTAPVDGSRASVFEPPGLFMAEPQPPPRGTLSDEQLGQGSAGVTVTLDAPATVLFRTTYHPGWRATVDGVPAEPLLLTPGFLGVDVPAGRHRLQLAYRVDAMKWLLLVLGLPIALALERRARRWPLADSVRATTTVHVATKVDGPSTPASAPVLAAARRLDMATWCCLGAALLVHLLLMPARGWEGDVYWFAAWTRASLEHGVAHLAEFVWCDYPPLYLYVLQGLGSLWQILAGSEWPADGTLVANVLLKLPATLATLVTAVVLGGLARERLGSKTALLVVLAYALNPALLFNGPVWGQVDALLALLLLLAVVAVASGRIPLGFAWLAAALLCKQQAIVVVPVLLLFALHAGGVRSVLLGLRTAAVVAAALLLPFYIEGTTQSLFTSLMTVTDRYPFVSMNAHNLWWLWFGPASLKTSDVMRFGAAAVTYRSLGFALLATATVLILWRSWCQLQDAGKDRLMVLAEACALQFLAFYLLPTQMHERYVVPALVFVAVLCIGNGRRWGLYVCLSAIVTLSLASTLYVAFPQFLGPITSLLRADRGETYVAAGGFLLCFIFLFSQGIDRRTKVGSIAMVATFALCLGAVGLLPIGDRIHLCEWSPIRQAQGWGTPQLHRSVDGNRLSMAGFVFRHGIGTHAPASRTYHLNGAFSSFEAVFGGDDEVGPGHRMQVRVLTDDAVRFDSGIIPAGGFPRRVQVSVAGAEFLTLEVLDGGDGRDFDHVDWGEPVVRR